MKPIEAIREAVRKPLEGDSEIYWAGEYGRPVPSTSIDALTRAALTALAENITPEMARSGAVAIAAAGCSDEAAVSSFRAMIDEALGETGS